MRLRKSPLLGLSICSLVFSLGITPALAEVGVVGLGPGRSGRIILGQNPEGPIPSSRAGSPSSISQPISPSTDKATPTAMAPQRSASRTVRFPRRRLLHGRTRRRPAITIPSMRSSSEATGPLRSSSHRDPGTTSILPGSRMLPARSTPPGGARGWRHRGDDPPCLARAGTARVRRRGGRLGARRGRSQSVVGGASLG